MRNIINISLPEAMAKAVERGVKKGKFASTSEYFRHLLRAHEFASQIQKARSDFDNGKKGWKILKSVRDLD